MNDRRKVRARGPGLPLLVLLVLMLGTAPVSAGILFSDDFEDGIVDTSVYVAVGNAVITESGGRLHIQTFGKGDGVEIVMPTGTACVQLQTEIPEVEFDQFEAFGIAAIFLEEDGHEALGVGLEFLRPFWNRCQITWEVGGKSQDEGIWG